MMRFILISLAIILTAFVLFIYISTEEIKEKGEIGINQNTEILYATN